MESNDVILSCLKLTTPSNCSPHLPTSILDIYTVFQHTHMLSIGIQYHPYSDIHPTFRSFGVLGHLCSQIWCHYVMVEADIHLKLLPTSVLDIYKVFEHIDMLTIGIQYQPYTVIPTQLGSDFGALGHLWSQNDVIMSWLRLTSTSNCFPHPY